MCDFHDVELRLALTVPVAFVGALAVVWLIMRFGGRIGWVWANSATGERLPLALILVIVLGIVGGFLYAGHQWDASVTGLGLRCPNCGEALVGGRLSTVDRETSHTGKCPHCHAPVVSDVLHEP